MHTCLLNMRLKCYVRGFITEHHTLFSCLETIITTELEILFPFYKHLIIILELSRIVITIWTLESLPFIIKFLLTIITDTCFWRQPAAGFKLVLAEG